MIWAGEEDSRSHRSKRSRKFRARLSAVVSFPDDMSQFDVLAGAHVRE